MHLPDVALPGARGLYLDPAGQAIAARAFGPRSDFWEPQQLLNLPQQGSFAPTIIGTTTAGAGTYTVQVGQYIKIGSLVFFQARIDWTAHTGTGNMRISGLPFTSVAVANSQTGVNIGILSNVALTANNICTAYVEAGTSQVVFVQYPTGGGASTAVPIDAAATIAVSGCYRI